MTLTLTYLDDLSRVRVAVSAWDASITAALVERSTDQIRWVPVRGGAAVAVSGGALNLDDYEFADAIANFYRVSPAGDVNLLTVNQASVETDLTGWVSSSACTILRTTAQAAHGVASIEVTSTTASTCFVDNDPAPTPITVGRTYTAVAEFRGATLGRVVGVTLVFKDAPGGSAVQSFGAVSPDPDTTTGWTQVAVTGVAPVGATVAEVSLRVHSTATSEVHYADRIGVWEGDDTTWQMSTAVETDSITVALAQPWLKSMTRPFLNRPFTLYDFGEVTRPARAGVFPVSGRTFPVAVTDVRLGRQQSIQIHTEDTDGRRELDTVLASGDSMFVHMPDACPVDTMYVVIGEISEARTSFRYTQRRIFELPLTEVAAPHFLIVGGTNTCQGVLNTYATCAAVLAAVATCQDLIEQIADASDVIVE